jgi:tRNA A37 N6-isopentenylltransferase MiaA
MSQITEADRLLEHLTQEAMDAATEGKWDQVAQFYERRASGELLQNVSPDVARKLIPYDQWMMTRIREVQALTQQHLNEAQDHRRRLETLKRQWIGNQAVQGRHLMSI